MDELLMERDMLVDKLKKTIKSLLNVHRPDGSPNVFIFSTPRSGSTWLMEMIWSQPGFKYCNEPLDLRNPFVRRHLGIDDWRSLYDFESNVALRTYFQAFCDGRFHFKDPDPRRRYYRPFTRRLVFKVIHGAEDRVNWLANMFNGRVLYLIRHPIPVSLSRQLYPRVEAFLESDYRRHFTEEQLQIARRVFTCGSDLDIGVLSWCLQNAVILEQATDDWVVVSYEQLVIEPEPVVVLLAANLQLGKPDLLRERLTVPSLTTAQSDRDTRRFLSSSTEERRWLVEKWRDQVSREKVHDAMEILKYFQIEAYELDDVLPIDKFWIS